MRKQCKTRSMHLTHVSVAALPLAKTGRGDIVRGAGNNKIPGFFVEVGRTKKLCVLQTESAGKTNT